MTEKELMETTVEHYGRRFTFDCSQDLTATEYIEDVIEPLMISMGYSPISVYEATNNVEMLEVLKGHDYDV